MAEHKEFMTHKEKLLKQELINLLRNDGRGHTYPKFAKRLEAFNINIVTDDPSSTASVDEENLVIYINEAFLRNRAHFNQLSLLIRHEVAHYLMRHMARGLTLFIEMFGEEAAEHLSASNSLFTIKNWIADFNVSDMVYMDYDKVVNPETGKLATQLQLGAETIYGLVTEGSRPDWVNLSFEEMFKRWKAELDGFKLQLSKKLIAFEQGDEEELYSPLDKNNPDDNIRHVDQQIFNIYWRRLAGKGSDPVYFTPSDVKLFLENKGSWLLPINNTLVLATRKELEDIPRFKYLIKVIESIYNSLTGTIVELAKTGDKTALQDFESKILKEFRRVTHSNLFESVTLNNPVTNKTIITVYSPEEKAAAVDTVIAMVDNSEFMSTYDKYYNLMLQLLGQANNTTITPEQRAELQDILNIYKV